MCNDARCWQSFTIVFEVDDDAVVVVAVEADMPVTIDCWPLACRAIVVSQTKKFKET